MAIGSLRHVCTYLLVPLLGGAASGVFAGTVVVPPVGEIVYEPLAVTTAVPTLSEWGLMAMMALLVLLAYRVLRERLQGKPLASVVLAGVLGLGVVSGGYWGRPALAAVIYNTFQFSSASGGSYTFLSPGGEWQGTNTTAVPQRIKSMTRLDANYSFITPVGAPECTVGMVVPVGGTCHARIVLVAY